ncbi:MAG: hypothetical protein RIS90_2799 [Pseudomonadota bacterium]
MRFNLTRLSLGIASASLLGLYGCGGGSTASPGGDTPNTPVAPTVLSGVAATGAAFEDATVTVTDSTGNVVGTSSTIGADGVYSITLAAGAVAPFVLTAARTGADGASESLVSVIASVTGSSATANITPITNLIAARLSPSGDPSKLGAELAAKTATLTASNVGAKVDEVQTILAPILAATETSATNPLTGSFAVNGSGYDRLLDSIKVSVIPASATTSNIEVSIKQQQAEDEAPVAIQFSTATAAAAVPAIPTIDKTKLVVAGTADLIKSFLAQLTSCYALPLATRVDSAISNGLATGTAANVVATACKASFYGDNPGNFKSNGNVVGRDGSGNGAFGGLFREGATGVVFSQGSYEFTRQNGDIVAGYKSKDSAGNEAFDTFVLRKDTDGKLKLIGNQYNYGGGVSAYQQIRTFVNDTASTYYSTGYNLNLPLMSGVAYVKITTPKGNTLTMIPGSDGMVFPRLNASRQAVQSDGVTLATTPSTMTPSGTSFIRIRSEYADTTSTASDPAARESGLFFSSTEATESEISGYGNQSLWVFKYYNSSNTLLATQSYKTRARANTIAEMRTRAWAKLDTGSIEYLKSNFVANTATAPNNNSYTKLPTTGLATPSWEVPSGALPPTEVKLFGRAGPDADGGGTKVNFQDGQSVGSTKRTVTITCANGSGEKHCVTGNTGYTAKAIMLGLHLWARDPSGRDYANFYATYNLN